MGKKVDFDAYLVKADVSEWPLKSLSIELQSSGKPEYEIEDLIDLIKIDQPLRVTLETIVPEVKSCPFCGGDSRLQESELDGGGYRVRCADCLATTGIWRPYQFLAIRDWNRRRG